MLVKMYENLLAQGYGYKRQRTTIRAKTFSGLPHVLSLSLFSVRVS
jgi:hypothetical protein